MKVMLVNSVYGIGSTGKIVKDLHNQINSNGDQAVICYGRGKRVDDLNVKKICSKSSFYSHACLSRLTGLSGLFSNRATKTLIEEIESFSPDIIHLHNLHGYYMNYYSFVDYIKKTDIPIVWTLHDELMYTGNCSYAFSCEKWKIGCKNCPQKREYPKSLFLDTSGFLYKKKKQMFSNFDNCTYVTPSKWLADRVKGSIIHSSKIRVIQNGIDTEKTFKPSFDHKLYESINPEHRKIVLTVTDDVFNERKGLKYYIELASENQELLFVVVGGIIKDCKCNNIVFVELIHSQEELAKYYSIADAFVITSLCDNFPTVCLEALACGTPVVGFNTGGTPETAPNDDIGSFCEFGNVEKLSFELKKVINNKVMGDRAREYATSHYSYKTMLNEYSKLYKELIGNE